MSDFPSLDQIRALRKAKMGPDSRPGRPPVRMYWMLRELGEEISRRIISGASVETIFMRIQDRTTCDRNTLRRAIILLQHEAVHKALAEKDWERLEQHLFAGFPDYQMMPFYRDYIQGKSTSEALSKEPPSRKRPTKQKVATSKARHAEEGRNASKAARTTPGEESPKLPAFAPVEEPTESASEQGRGASADREHPLPPTMPNAAPVAPAQPIVQPPPPPAPVAKNPFNGSKVHDDMMAFARPNQPNRSF